MNISIVHLRFHDIETKVLQSRSKVYRCSIPNMVKQIVYEKLEEENDLEIIDDYEKRKKKDTLKLKDHDEIWKELEL